MDDYQTILGMELLSAKMVLMPHLRSVSIMDEKSPCMVPTATLRKDNGKVTMISALQLNRGLKHDDRMDKVATREVSKNSPGLVPEALAPILKEFARTTPAKLPRWWPPRHEVGNDPAELKKLGDRRRGSMEFRAGNQFSKSVQVICAHLNEAKACGLLARVCRAARSGGVGP
ncbi:hypothetical protein EJ110_NYTH23685 [Nymphaea thermarum]|nr:hypothetical protein EJ110_NYTH23685 [Nymphaea thermarum]